MPAEAAGHAPAPGWDEALAAFEAHIGEWERWLATAGPFSTVYPSEEPGAVVWPGASEPIPRHLQERARRLGSRYEAVVDRLTARRAAIGGILASEPASPRASAIALFLDERA